MFKTHHKKEIVNLCRVDPNETISTAKNENSCLGGDIELILVLSTTD